MGNYWHKVRFRFKHSHEQINITLYNNENSKEDFCMTVKEIVAEYLKANGYGGLSDGYDCGCFDDDLIPCGEGCDQCVAVFKIPAHCDTCDADCDGRGESEFCLTSKKPSRTITGEDCNDNEQDNKSAEILPCENAPACKNEDTQHCEQCVDESDFYPA